LNRTINYHHDGHGLAESIEVTADDRDLERGGNASHRYRAVLGEKEVLAIQFQHGPRDGAGSTPGVLDSVLLAILIDRYEGFQHGPFASEENEKTLTYLYAALSTMKERADRRAAQNVLGKNERGAGDYDAR